MLSSFLMLYFYIVHIICACKVIMKFFLKQKRFGLHLYTCHGHSFISLSKSDIQSVHLTMIEMFEGPSKGKSNHLQCLIK